MEKIITTTILVCLTMIVNAQISWTGFELVAHYPMTTNSVDATNNNDELNLINIPLGDNGAYSNGIYLGSFADGCKIATPTIQDMNLDGFGVSLDIKYDTTYNTEMPIFVLGEFNRYASLYLDMWQGEVKLKMIKNYGGVNVVGDIVMSENTWYHLDLQHKSDTTSFYMNNELIGFHVGTFDFYGGENDPATKTLSNRNAGEGRTFHGNWRDLKIYSLPVSSSLKSVSKDLVKLTPNPAYDFLNIDFKDDFSNIDYLKIYDIKGKLQKYIVNPNQQLIDISFLKEGIYLLKIKPQNKNMVIKKFIKI